VTAKTFLKSIVFSQSTLSRTPSDLREPLSLIARSSTSGGEKFEKRLVSRKRERKSEKKGKERKAREGGKRKGNELGESFRPYSLPASPDGPA